MAVVKMDSEIARLYENLLEVDSPSSRYLLLISSKVMEWNQNGSLGFNIDRLYDEFVYYKYYSKSDIDYGIIFFVPLILITRSFENYESILMDYLDKYCKFFKLEKKKFAYFLDVQIMDYLIRALLINKNFLKEDENLKRFLNRILEAIKSYNPSGLKKRELIDFQIEKISYIEDIHKLEEDKFASEYELLNIINRLIIKDNLMAVKKGEFLSQGQKELYKVFDDFMESRDSRSESRIFVEGFTSSMAKYIISMRAKKLVSKTYISRKPRPNPKTFINYNLGDEFVDPILNKSKVISKNIDSNICKMNLSTKTGIYEFSLPIKK